jgi:REP element-mobilizing transposase RayT
MTFYRIYYHLIWTTKYRSPYITPKIEEQLFPFLVNKSLGLGYQVFAMNGSVDHVHMVISIPP